MIENFAQQFFKDNDKKENNDMEVIEKQYTVEIWFPSKEEASLYKKDRKYSKDFELLKDVKQDPNRRSNKYCRLYQVK